jgi:ubiquinone/menaquinone biosynthesis C-methylase UbiE
VSGKKNARIVDLGCGTGKFTVLLAARPEQFEVVAVEPHKGMREELVKKNLRSRIKIMEGDAGNMPIEEGWGDALIAAQVRENSVKSVQVIIANHVGS